MASQINASNSGFGGIVSTGDSSGVLQLQTTGTTALTIDTSQRVGIGTSSPSAKLHVSGISLGNSNIRLTNTFTNGRSWELNPYASGVSDVPFTIRDVTAGADRITIDSSGNVGIGVTPSAWDTSVSGKVLQISSAGLFNITTGNNRTYFTSNLYYASGNFNYINTASATMAIQYDGTHQWFNAPSGTAGTAATLTERMRIDSSGKVGIGTTSPAETLSLMTASGSTSIRLSTNNNQNNNLSLVNDATDFIIGTNHGTTGAKIKMNLTCPDNSLIITSGGEVYIAGTTDRGAFNLQCNGTGVWGAGAYTNGSDERIKDNITPLDTGLDVVAKLNPVTYKYKEEWSKDQSIQTGFIAQDLLVALEGKNYVDGIVNQSSEYMSVAYQNIIPILTKAIQEQQTIINDLKARIEILEAK